MQSPMKPNEPAEPRKSLAELRYLERLIDFEGAMDHGPLSGKDILVYAPGKTGTVSLFTGIQAHLVKTRGWLDADRKMLHNHSNRHIVGNLKLDVQSPSREQLLERTIVRDLVDYKALTGSELLIVSSYREPLGRAFSSVFQQLDDAIRRGDRTPDALSLPECEHLVLEWLATTMEHFDHPLTEIEPAFFETETFDHSSRSCFVQRDHYRMLVLTLPYADAWARACERHLGLDGIEFVHQNNADQKSLGAVYRQFKAELRLPADLIRRLFYDSAETACLRWFFSAAEVDELCDRAIESFGRTKPRRGLSAWLRRLHPNRPLARIQGPAVEAKVLSLNTRLHADQCKDRKRVTVRVRLKNTGEELWTPKGSSSNCIAVALRAQAAGGKLLTSNWQHLPSAVAPGDDLVVDLPFDIPADAVGCHWSLDLIRDREQWLSQNDLLLGDRRCRLNSAPTDGATKVGEDLEPQLVFLHIPKTAGGSFNRLLARNYESNIILQHQFTAGSNNPLRPAGSSNYALLAGHRPRRDYPYHMPALFTAILREPIARALSLFALYMRPDLSAPKDAETKRLREQQHAIWSKRGMHADSVLKSLEHCPSFRHTLVNMQCRYLSYCEPSFDAALQTLRSDQFVVGCVEALPRFTDYLGHLLGWTSIDMPHSNRSAGNAYDELAAEPGLRETIEELNREDIRLYRFVREECDGLFIHLPDPDRLRGSRIDLRGSSQADGIGKQASVPEDPKSP